MKEWRAVQLLHQTYVLTLTLDENLTTAQKHSVLSNYISTIKRSDQTCIITSLIPPSSTLNHTRYLLLHSPSSSLYNFLAINLTCLSANLSGCLIGAASLFLVVDPNKARREGILAAIHDINYSYDFVFFSFSLFSFFFSFGVRWLQIGVRGRR